MGIVRKATMSVCEKKEMEYLLAQQEQIAANVDYIAMMTDIDLEDGESEVSEDEQ